MYVCMAFVCVSMSAHTYGGQKRTYSGIFGILFCHSLPHSLKYLSVTGGKMVASKLLSLLLLSDKFTSGLPNILCGCWIHTQVHACLASDLIY